MSQSLEFKIPEGYVFDKDNSTDEIIRFKLIEKKLTYANIIKNLYSRGCYYINNNPTSTKQLQQLLALNKLMNVAKYLNGDWEPDWNNLHQRKYFVYYDHTLNRLETAIHYIHRFAEIYFKSPELVRQAIEILGEDEVKKALGIFE